MLFGAVLIVLALSGTFAIAHSSHDGHRMHPVQLTKISSDAEVYADFQVSSNSMTTDVPVFQQACRENKIEDIHASLAKTRVSFESLGSKCTSGWAVQDTNVLSTHFFDLLIKLQVLLKIIHDNGKVSACQQSITPLNAPLKVMADFLVAKGVDVESKCKSYGSQIDLSLLANVGINIGINVQASVGTHVTTGSSASVDAGVHAGLSVDAVVPEFQPVLSTIVSSGPTFEKSCKENNIAPVVQGLANIHASISTLGSKCKSAANTRASISVIEPHFFDLMLKLQVLLKIIDAHEKISACQDSIVAFKAPLSIMTNILIAGGVDIQASVKAYAGLDLGFFAKIGIDLDVHAQVTPISV